VKIINAAAADMYAKLIGPLYLNLAMRTLFFLKNTPLSVVMSVKRCTAELTRLHHTVLNRKVWMVAVPTLMWSALAIGASEL